jgi:hypothetical protein
LVLAEIDSRTLRTSPDEPGAPSLGNVASRQSTARETYIPLFSEALIVDY